MSEQSNQNSTPTVQVKEIGLPEQANVGKILLFAGASAGAVAGLISLVTGKKVEEDPTASLEIEAAKDYLRDALQAAEDKDYAKAANKQRKRAEDKVKKQVDRARKDTSKFADQIQGTSEDVAKMAKQELGSLIDAVRSGSLDIDHFFDTLTDSPLVAKLREFGDEAKEIVEQGKMKTSEVAEKAHDEALPHVKEAAAKAKQQAKEQIARTQNEVIPSVQRYTSEASAHAKDVLGTASDDAEEFLADAAHQAEAKRQQATSAVQRGGRETRSLLIWGAAAGILVYNVLLNEEMQTKVKDIATEVFVEARDMYSDLKGTTKP